MKRLILLGALLIAATVAQAEGAPGNPDFAKFKKDKLEGLETRISVLQEQKSCLGSASSHEDMKKCHDSMEGKEKELKAKHEAMKAQHIDDKIKKLQEEKAKLGK